MIKYFFGICLGVFFPVGSLQASNIFTEIKGGYFFPSGHKFQRIYSGGGIYGAEISCQAWRNLYAWGSGSFFHKKGFTIGTHDPTKIILVPLGVGLKCLFPIWKTDVYLGVGALSTYMHIKDDSPFLIRTTAKWEIGAIAKGGIIAKIGRFLFIDLFTDYSYTNISIHKTRPGIIRHDANLSGWTLGIGVGYYFAKRVSNA